MKNLTTVLSGVLSLSLIGCASSGFNEEFIDNDLYCNECKAIINDIKFENEYLINLFNLEEIDSSIRRNGNVLYIKEEGVYILSGSSYNFNLVIDVEGYIEIKLKDVSILSKSTIINNIQCNNLLITLDGINTLTTTFFDDDAFGVVNSSGGVTISGNGLLNIISNNKGITVNKNLLINECSVDVISKSNAVEVSGELDIIKSSINITTNK